MFSAASVIALLASLLVLYPRSGSPMLLDKSCGRTRTGYSPQTLGPWTALLHENGRIACGGTLINSRFILTAAHCLKAGETQQVRLGEYGRMGAEQPENYNVDMAFRHRHFNNKTLENDIGLLRLSRPVQYKDHIKPICIVSDPSSNELSLADNIHEFHGTAWDRTWKNRCQVGALHGLSITRIQCPKAPMDKLQFCGLNRNANDFCDGPSGSALTSVMWDRTVQIGIAGYNDVDCQTTRVYTDVMRYSEWIQQILHFYHGTLNQIITQPVVFPNGSHSANTVPAKTTNQANQRRWKSQ